jgi:N-acetylneuraminate synthase
MPATVDDGAPIAPVRIGSEDIGPGRPAFVVAEIGINHNGDVELAKKLVAAAVTAGVQAVKFQKRTPEQCVPPEQRDIPRDTPWGVISYFDYRTRLELGQPEYEEIDAFCRSLGIPWFASCWDEESVDFIEQFDPPCYKIASASLTDDSLLAHTRAKGRPVVLSTGMSSLEQIDRAVDVLGRDGLVLLHTTSTYPSNLDELNLLVIPRLAERYLVPVGYSAHEVGLAPTLAAVVLGACIVERHLTLDRAIWGSDQAASVEPQGLSRVVKDIRVWEQARGDGEKRVYESELPSRARLRRVGA